LAIQEAPPQTDARARLIGIALLAFSTFVFGFSNVLAKFLTHEYPIGEALLIRSGFGLLLILPFIRVRDIAIEARTSLWLHLLRMVLSAVEIVCFYWAVASLQLADVTAFYLSTPILLTAIAALALGERVDRARWIATLLGFAGVVIALQPSGAALSLHALVALLGSLLYAVFLTVTRRLRGTPNAMLVMLQLLALVITGAATTPFAWVTPSPGGFALMAGVGVIGIVGYVCVNRALQLAPASVVAPFQYLSIIWSVVLGYLAFGDVPEPHTMAGAALIIVAGGFILFQERARAG
jgi:drug/metabolite transporter (DMT)-like permease